MADKVFSPSLGEFVDPDHIPAPAPVNPPVAANPVTPPAAPPVEPPPAPIQAPDNAALFNDLLHSYKETMNKLASFPTQGANMQMARGLMEQVLVYATKEFEGA